MPDRPTCPECGTPLPPDAPAGLCPKCLLQAGIPSDTVNQPFALPDPEHLAACFPNLTFLKLLGHGGMGAVYQARQKDLDRDVAVKILPPEVGQAPSFAARFSREAKTLAKLNHPNIVQIYDFGRADEYFYFVMEFVDGVNLRQLVQSGELEPKQTLSIITRICEALQFAHDAGVVHRDIKPENILVDQRGHVKIADFGLAMLLHRAPADVTLTGTHQVMGTLHYMAPEQMKGSRSIDHRVDLYSLGVVFYELLTGDLPIGHFEAPSKRMQVDVRLDEVVLRALATEPERRYQHASDLQHDVEQISKTEMPHSPPVASSSSEQLASQSKQAYGTGPPQQPAWTPVRLLLLAVANLWLLAAIVLMLGRKVARTQPLMYSFFDQGAWFYPSTYNSVVLICAVLSAVCFLFAMGRRRYRANRHQRVVPCATPDTMQTDGNVQVPTSVNTSTPRFSRQALVAAGWASLFFLNTFLMFGTWTTVERAPSRVVRKTSVAQPPGRIEELGSEAETSSSSSPKSNGSRRVDEKAPSIADDIIQTPPRRAIWQWILLCTVLPLGLTAPFGTTILGCVAISTIRHSRGRLIGLPLAVADALFFPLLTLDFALLAILIYVLNAMTTPAINMAAVALLVLIPLLVFDVWIASIVWKRASQEPATS